MNCTTARNATLLLLYGELEEPERLAAEAHLTGCDTCRLAAGEAARLQAILGQRPEVEPAEDLLARCRIDLSSALAGEAGAGPLWTRRLRSFWSQAKLSPAYGLLFLAVGFMAGAVTLGSSRVGTRASTAAADVLRQATAAGEEPVTNLRSFETIPGQDRVRLTYDTQQHGSLEGSPEDPAVRALLLQTLRDSQNPGLRLQAIEALRRYTDNGEVRQALLAALRADVNPGARLKALDVLDTRVHDDAEIRTAMLDALQRDNNQGVRVRAIDTLSRAGDPRMLPVMERLSREDPDTYIRMRSGDFVDAMYARNTR